MPLTNELPDHCTGPREMGVGEVGGWVVTHIVMKGFGLTGVITCVPSFWGRTVQIPKYTVTQLKEKQHIS